jgi:hypothetical protein
VGRGLLPREPNYHTVFPVGNDAVRGQLGDERLDLTTPALKRLAIIRSAQQALENLLPAVVELCKMYPPEHPVHREILLQFVQAHWADAFEHRRFRFGNAMAVETSLPKAMQAPETGRVVAIFRAVHGGFTIRGGLPEVIRSWLFGGRDSQTHS